MRDRLKEIEKKAYHQELTNPNTKKIKTNVFIPKEDYNWLMEQAEKAKKLEDAILKDFKTLIDLVSKIK